MNIKKMLIEKERVEWVKGNAVLAEFLSKTLEYIISLEEDINKRDALIEEFRYRQGELFHE
jgi:hypothetical protein